MKGYRVTEWWWRGEQVEEISVKLVVTPTRAVDLGLVIRVIRGFNLVYALTF